MPFDPEEGERERLAEMVREAERVLDHQVRAAERLDERSQQGVALATAALGGALALGSLVAGSAPRSADHLFLPLLAGGGVLNLFALFQLLQAHAGLREGGTLRVAPGLAWLDSKAGQRTWTLLLHLRSVIAGARAYEEYNRRALLETAARRRRGLAALLASLAVYAAAYLYVFGTLIRGA